MFSSFQEVADNGQIVENAPGVGDLYQRPDLPPPTPATPTSDRNPQQEAWGWQQQREWNAKIEKTMATKAEMQQGFDRLEKLIQQR